MTITIAPELEARIREKAQAECLTVDAYVERLVSSDQFAEEELEALAVEGLNSGEPIEVGPDYWIEKHRRLDERLGRTGTRREDRVISFVPKRIKTWRIRLSTMRPQRILNSVTDSLSRRTRLFRFSLLSPTWVGTQSLVWPSFADLGYFE